MISRIARRIARRIISSVSLDLKGPFKLLNKSPSRYILSVDDIMFTNEDFIKLDMGSVGDDHREDWNEPGNAELSIQVDFGYDTPDPGSGYTGGWSNDGYEVVAINNILLENPEDRRTVTEAYDNQILGKMDDWAREHGEDAEGMAAEERAGI